ncbi:hypothetical protein GCM10010495_45300 [Kitasatospora herbaricolor]|nr:hypothetical protein [Kitasatospora herbaricolor]GGV24629.1 hypothetical protein GCM10010495_45300 [Kitasatospora herbaricolor]
MAALGGPVRVTLDRGSAKTVHAPLPCRRPAAPEVAAAPAARRRSWLDPLRGDPGPDRPTAEGYSQSRRLKTTYSPAQTSPISPIAKG